ncbi:MAG: hypothetical protein ACR2L2_07080, partial [Acidobacteriota bacterium]
MKFRGRLCVAFLCALLAAGSVFADVTYKDVSKIDGAMFGGAMKAIIRMSGQNLDNIAAAHYLKGGKMRTETSSNNNLQSIQIVDLDKELMISIDPKKKTYSVVTFAELRAQMDEALRKMRESSGKKNEKEDVQLTPRISVKQTGQTATIAGYPASETQVTITLEAKDKKSGDTGNFDVNSSLWLAKGVAGAAEVNEFGRRFAEKLGTPQMMGMLQAFMTDARVVEGMQEAQRQQAKFEGFPVRTVVSMGVTGSGAESSQQQASAQKQREEEQSSIPSVKSVGKIFGGFGRKKKEEEKKEEKEKREKEEGKKREKGGTKKQKEAGTAAGSGTACACTRARG